MTVYLIETNETGSPTWWDGFGWSYNGWKAIWFCREIDAENILKYLSNVPNNTIVTEHMFI